MTFREIANNIDKGSYNRNYFDWGEISDAVGLEYFGCYEYDRLQSFWFAPWYDTDSYVGFAMYFLDEDPVGYSYQSGRKSIPEYYWFSNDCANRVREYILSLIKEETVCALQMDDIDRDVGDMYSLDYNSEVIDFSKGTYRGKKFSVEKVNRGILADTLKIRTDDDGIIEINIKDIKFGYCLKEDKIGYLY